MQPTITFIIPIKKRNELLIEEINTIFKFSELYPGFCELIVVTDEEKNVIVKLAWIAMKLNKENHPYVRTKIIRYISKVNIKNLIETGLKTALGEKIIIATNNLKIKLKQIQNLDPLKRKILKIQHLLDIEELMDFINPNNPPSSHQNIEKGNVQNSSLDALTSKTLENLPKL